MEDVKHVGGRLCLESSECRENGQASTPADLVPTFGASARKSLDLRFIEYAIAATQYGSFRQAGRSLGIIETTVSRRVRILEDSLGFALFYRSVEGVQLTESGSTFLKDAILGVDRINRAVDHAWQKQEGARDRIEIGIVGSLSKDELRTPLSQFQQQYVATGEMTW